MSFNFIRKLDLMWDAMIATLTLIAVFTLHDAHMPLLVFFLLGALLSYSIQGILAHYLIYKDEQRHREALQLVMDEVSKWAEKNRDKDKK